MDKLREAIVFLLENPVSDDDEVQANAILAEIDKTHRIMPRAPHGTLQKYTRGGCRCEACTRANRDWSRERRRRIKEAKGA